MGDYTGLRFKGYVKPEYREDFESIAMEGEWQLSKHQLFRNFSYQAEFRASFIPCGVSCYMPTQWNEPCEFDRCYEADTGQWVFQCSLKNYNEEIEKFMNMIPAFIETLEHLEVRYEEWQKSKFYELANGQLREVNHE